MPTDITVRGSFTALHPPERGTVRAAISFEGSEMEATYDEVARELEAVKTSVLRLTDGAESPVTWWSADQLRTWSTRPWHEKGKQLPLVHHASVGVEVKFRDFAELSRWVGEHVAGTEGFSVSGVRWTLVATHREQVVAEVRANAVADAVTRAQQYADALGLGPVRPVAIADPGMLGINAPTGGGHADVMAVPAGAPRGGGPDVELFPQDIRVSATVEARFVADG